MDADERIAQSMVEVLSSKDLTDATANLAEAALDTITEPGLARDIPVVSTFLGLVRTANGVREHFLARKLKRFLRDAAAASASDRRVLFGETFGDKKRRQRLCTLILHVLDELRDEDRVAMISALLVAMLTGDLRELDFRRLCEVARIIEPPHVALLSR